MAFSNAWKYMNNAWYIEGSRIILSTFHSLSYYGPLRGPWVRWPRCRLRKKTTWTRTQSSGEKGEIFDSTGFEYIIKFGWSLHKCERFLFNTQDILVGAISMDFWWKSLQIKFGVKNSLWISFDGSKQLLNHLISNFFRKHKRSSQKF